MPPRLALGPLAQVSRTVADLPTSVAWYRDVVGLSHLYTYGRLAFFSLGGPRLLLTQRDQVAADESILYFAVGDIDHAHAALGARGARFMSPPHRVYTKVDGGEEWMAFFADPEDRALAIVGARAAQPGKR